MSEVILLVGPQGSGKSTWANQMVDNPVVISQDTMGQKGHVLEYEKALKAGANKIVIDRINHTRDQRKKYISLAKAAGYTTKIYVINEPFGICLDRILKREGHATIKTGDLATAISALKTYFTQYEIPTENEADEVNFLQIYDPYLQDLDLDLMTNDRTIIIGDVHGCFDELQELLTKIKWDSKKDVVIFTGDLIDRGPKIKECLEFVMNTENVFTVMSNHEWRLARYLATELSGAKSKIKHSHGFTKTLEQIKDMDKTKLLNWVWSLPYVIKFNDNYVLHAGINPRYSIERQSKEFLMYARKYDSATNSFNIESAPNWYMYKLHDSITGKIFFGHDVHMSDAGFLPSEAANAHAMDGGCCFGGTLRAAVIEGNVTVIHEVQSKQPKTKHEELHETWAEPFEKRVLEGYLHKQETPELILYNYSDKCTFEKKWDQYTSVSRGIIFEKSTGHCVAKPFPKFFNLGEGEASQLQNLPKEPYQCFEKMDGSLGIIYNYKGDWQVATRGSFSSDQAKIGAEILKKYNMDGVLYNITLLAEIIYPENRVNPGARLVIDYGSERMLVLLAAYARKGGEELPRETVEIIGRLTGMPVAKKYDHTIEEMIALQKTLPADREGFVVRFQNGFRVKIKGDEYMKMHRILNSITPLFIWELMNEDPGFQVPSPYLISVPEEYRDEVLEIAYKLKTKRKTVLSHIEGNANHVLAQFGLTMDDYQNDPQWKKKVGQYLQKGIGLSLAHSQAMFPRLLGKEDHLEEYVRKTIRPTGNIL